VEIHKVLRGGLRDGGTLKRVEGRGGNEEDLGRRPGGKKISSGRESNWGVEEREGRREKGKRVKGILAWFCDSEATILLPQYKITAPFLHLNSRRFATPS